MTAEQIGLLPWPTRDDLDDAQREFYDETLARFDFPGRRTPIGDAEGRLHGPYTPMLYAPAIGRALHTMGGALRFDGSLPRAVFEVIVCVIAVRRDADYEWYAHAPMALEAGVPAATLEAVRTGHRDVVEGVLGTPLLQLVDTLLDHRETPAESIRAVEEQYGRIGVMETIATVGHFDLIASLMRTWRIPLPPGATGGIADPVSD